MRAKRYIHVRHAITWSIAPACDRCIESFQRFLAPVHASISDRQAKPWSAGEILCLFVKCNRIIEASHLAIQRCQCRLAIMGECRVKLECALPGHDRFIVKTEIAVKLAGEVAHPE